MYLAYRAPVDTADSYSSNYPVFGACVSGIAFGGNCQRKLRPPLFPGESPLGKRFSRVDGSALVAQEIVGITRDAKYASIRGTAPPTVYNLFRPAESAALQIRTQMTGSSLMALLREELPPVHPAFRMVDLTMHNRRSSTIR